jgi:hypothetical protein
MTKLLLRLVLLAMLAPPLSAQIALDVTTSQDGSTASTTIATSTFSTASGNELLLAFISTDYLSGANTTVTAVSGAGLTWVPVIRTNVQNGTSEIWRAFAVSPLANVSVTATLSQKVVASITVMSFTGVDSSGTNGSGAIGAIGSGNANPGAPTASLTTTRNGSWVVGVGNDWDNPIERTVGPGQTLVHQDLTPTGDTYWVQRETNPISSSGTLVTINATAPTSDRYNLSICEILAASTGGQTWSISGTITPASYGSGATVTLTGTSNGSTTADPSGNYSFSGLTNGSYTVTPTKAGFTFNPPSQGVTINNANQSGINFAAQPAPPPGSLAIDAVASRDQGSASLTVTSPKFSTTSPNELLLAFVATDYVSGTNTKVTGISGAGLTWVLVVRTNVEQGTSEIWRALATSPLSNVTVTATLSQKVASSITVMSFIGADSSGSNGSGAIGAVASGSGDFAAPFATLTTTRNNSWLVGVGNDWDRAIARKLGPNQTMVHQYLSPGGDTYWVQRQTSATPQSGTVLSINDTGPTGDRFNLSICEVLPAVSPQTPTVSINAPATGATVSSRTTLWATAPGNVAVSAVQFVLDGVNLGNQITSPPFSMNWDTTTVSNGQHILSAIAYNAAGNQGTSAPITVTVDNSGNPSVVGSWSSVVNLPAVAVNLILLKNNKVLFYEDGSTPTIWDYMNNTFTNVPAPADLFCSGHAALADGRILVTGGYGQSGNNFGISNAEIFDPTSNLWAAVPHMAYRRWYPTATTLSDGRVLVTAGWQTAEHTNAGIPEIYDPATNQWTQLTSANNPFETYPFIYLLPNGQLIHVGGSEYPTDTDILNLTSQSWSVVDPNLPDGASATMFLPGKIMKAGSATDSQGVGPSSNTTYVLDTTQPSPAWHQVPSMAYPRSFLNLTTLPDGTVLATGGETDKNGGNIANAVYAAELWSPQTQTWTTLSSMHTPREYHSTALLLPDGRVLVSGMGADFGNVPDELNAEFYSPPYLFRGPQPVISQAPSQLQYGSNFFVATPDASTIQSVVLIRTGAVTHFFDQNARYVPLNFQQTTGGLSVTAPANAYLAPPGYYMLFIVNTSGVPSVAPFVQLTQ